MRRLGGGHLSLYLRVKRLLKVIWVCLWHLGHRLGVVPDRRPQGPMVRILFYHRISDRPCTRGSELEVTPSAFARQLDSLANSGWRLVPLSAVPRLLTGAGKAGRYLAITFDDGYRDNVTAALPILRRYRAPAAFFVTTGFISTGRSYPWVCSANIDPESLPLTWDEICELKAAGCEIHSHGVTHRDLRALAAREAAQEMNDSCEEVHQKTGTRPSGFCYPFGHWTSTMTELVAEAGYELACTCEPGLNHSHTPRHALRRTVIQTSDTLAVFEAKLDGAFDWRVPRFIASPLKSLLLLLDYPISTT